MKMTDEQFKAAIDKNRKTIKTAKDLANHLLFIDGLTELTGRDLVEVVNGFEFDKNDHY